jgi:hypothetical protein
VARTPPSRSGRHLSRIRRARLAYALDDECASGRVVEPHGQDFLIFWRIVPALDRRGVREFKDDNAFGLRSAFDQFSRAAPAEEAAALLFKRGGDRRPVGIHPGLVGGLQFGDEIGRQLKASALQSKCRVRRRLFDQPALKNHQWVGRVRLDSGPGSARPSFPTYTVNP